ncbi:bis(5'-nucleosyl)-tetraphosphatase (symmetrical) [Natronocella acetinitrilica]|uniref:Bis(5'-nucleosyl)-tetraphosphatase, symmetrical n=1 Tax=Natronocella acetinitrilica TaxID=414046 RepID=A0AAE3FZY1_9GAMM|nr:bis(5'-nucleosyl)-tetraphosphatase (symmetrical) [Natronocella acetinitrilica]
MATYCIGDIQGCHPQFLELLERLDFRPGRDRLWLTGDLVNRGPQSLEVLRYVKAMGDHVVTVLGNHDLHLLAIWAGASGLKSSDTVADVLQAPDRDELMNWLRRQPLMHEDPTLGYVMTHAGIAPPWTLDVARACAREAEEVLRGDEFNLFMAEIYGNDPAQWDPALRGWDRQRYIINALTRMRYCAPDGSLLLDFKGEPGSQPPDYLPWFHVPHRHPLPTGTRLVTGHWSTLGFYDQPDVISIDTGCLWGGELTAIQLDADARRTTVKCPVAMKPA